ncbi:hypothetical protein BHM03_00036740 [Ensete ventricosum]|uniref:Pectate lyase superfamily protein domain-containing protein n=2 Tax=Ensete ventricosum TaxID=4639 RepID=A0A426ZMM5_ENSVE|nr:hypothetical protein B296_00005854 [Ensete ventricosum]RZS06134.1 hypothetical protein BHM03_00036740 [Ensete ventricosum]
MDVQEKHPCLWRWQRWQDGLRRPSVVLLLGAMALLGWSSLQSAWVAVAPAAAPATANRDVAVAGRRSCVEFYRPVGPRNVVFSIKEFGGVGDGTTSNTEAFRRAVRRIGEFGGKGGAQLNVPPGRWLTGSFNLTSNLTLFLEKDAVILGSQDPEEWPVIEPLPSYGRGRERLGGRHISLIHGEGLSDIVITDSSSHVCIEDCYIESGDDLVAVKSGWDHYGIAVAHPSSNIVIRRVSGTTPTCSGVGIGSEMSGGVSNVVVEDLHVWDSAAAVRLKTDVGRGGYITNVTVTNVTMERVKIPIRFSRGSNDHPDEGWDPKAFPRVKGVRISNVVGFDVGKAPVLEGIEGAVYEDVCIRNFILSVTGRESKWHCEFVAGEAYDVSPSPCLQLSSNGSSSWCRHSS